MAPDPIEPWLRRWSLILDGEPFTTRFGSRLAPVRRESEAAMLKIAVHAEDRRGGELMAWWDGQGAARVLRRAGEAILLERVSGPRSLAAMALAGGDDEATTILCDTAMRLHAPRPAPAPAGLVPLEIWFRSLGDAARRTGGLYATANSVAVGLLGEPRDIVVLHGDFHHDNVLDGGDRGWLVIDPKGLLGERGFEYANLFRNPTAELALSPGVMDRRLEMVAGTADLEPARLLLWVFAYAALGAAWSVESGHDPGPGLAIARQAAARIGIAV